jgi:hypothetical protein
MVAVNWAVLLRPVVQISLLQSFPFDLASDYPAAAACVKI